VEVPPGSEAQVDFGYAGLQLDPTTGRLRKSWVFVLVLAFSRHLYAEVVFDQRVETWLLLHRHALEALGGVPERLVLDYVPRHIIQFLCPTGLCGRGRRKARSQGENRAWTPETGHITIRVTPANSGAIGRSSKLAWCGMPL
jgi:hypothetical protein